MKFFTVPIEGGCGMEDELNLFLHSHKVAAVERHFSEHAACWTLCVTYVETGLQPDNEQHKKDKVDYKEILDEPTFARFTN